MDNPYLSVVVTSRNDDHGLNLRRRMQIFVTGLAAQAKRFRVPIELIMVEWNPPPENPGLVDALTWPTTKWVDSRIIQVPPELHRRYKHAEGLPVYQMIAKNVGIRRSRGEFVLATNIDLLFSNELFEFLAGRRLSSGKMYRVDRWDADENVPLDASIDEQLQYCATHLMRINGRGETYPVSATGERLVHSADINVAEEIEFDEREISVTTESKIEDPSEGDDESSNTVGDEHGVEAVPEPAVVPSQVLLKRDFVTLVSGFYQLENLAAETFRWASSRVAVEVTTNGPGREVCFDVDPTVELGPVELHFRVEKRESITTISERSVVKIQADFQVGTSVPIEVKVINPNQRKPLLVDPRDLGFRVYSLRCVAASSADARPQSGLTVSVAPKPAVSFLDRIRRLWKLWRSGRPGMRLTFPVPRALISWLKPRFEENGLSISITRERATGTSDDKVEVFRTPHWDNSGYSAQAAATTDEDTAAVVEDQDLVVGEGELFAAEAVASVDEDDVTVEEDDVAVEEELVAVEEDHVAVEEAMDGQDNYDVRSGADYLHTNACGDFTLMSREDWFDLRGYPEWDLYSMNIDSALCISAARAGIEEVFLTARVYHIEHSVGSGYSPEGQQVLWDRLRKKGIGWIEFQEIYDWDRQLRRLGSTMIFNRRDWGLIRNTLPDEIVLGANVDTEAPVASQ